MVFSSILFLFYFAPIFFLVYYFLPQKLKNTWLIISSLLFYWWGAPTFIYIFILSCLLDYSAAILYSKNGKKVFYYVAIIGNVALLLYFKYFNFFIENINEIIGQ